MTRATVQAAANVLAQDPGAGRVSLVADPVAAYKEAIDLAERLFTLDVTNVRVVDVTLTAAGWRFALNGGSALPALTGLNTFTTGESQLTDVWLPYSLATREVTPLDRNYWRVVEDPGGISFLESLEQPGAVGDVLRLSFKNKHEVHATDANLTTVPARFEQAFEVLTAAMVMQVAANKAAQNTGSSALPNDTVDRRQQADMLRRQSGDMMKIYDRLMGKTPSVTSGAGASAPVEPPPANAFRDLDAMYSHPFGGMFHSGRRH